MEVKKFLKIVVAILIVLNLGTLSFIFITYGKHRHHGKHRHAGKDNPGEFIIQELGFSETQVKQFDDLKLEHQTQMKTYRDSIKTQREKLPDLITTGNNSGADSVATKIGGYQKGIEICTYDHFKKVYALCDEKQKTKFKNIIGDVLTRMAPHHGRPPHR